MTTPVRLQRSRKRGFNLQAHSLAVNGLPAVNCARPSEWGNQFIVGKDGNAATCVLLFRRYFCAPSFQVHGKRWLEPLRGQNLACWCGLCPQHENTGKPLHIGCVDCAPCHVDVLGELANAPICEAIDERRIEKARAG